MHSSASSSHVPNPSLARIGALAACMTAVLGLVGLIGWLPGLRVMASVRAAYIPMAPSTGVAFTVLGVAMALHASRRSTAVVRGAATAGAFAACLGLVKLIEFVGGARLGLDVEAVMVRHPAMFGQVPLARMSPITACSFFLAGMALVLLTVARARQAFGGWIREIAGWAAALVLLTACTVLLGYAYNAPLLYGGKVIPMALLTGAGFLCAGVALAASLGPSTFPLRPFVGASARARLLRAFLPVTVGGLLVYGLGLNFCVTTLGMNAAIASAILTMAFAAIVTTAVTSMARSIGGAIDQAEVVLQESRDALECRVLERTTQLVAANEALALEGHERERVAAEIRTLNHALERRMAELDALNQELEAFSYSVSHDLRAPLRHVLGFASLLERSSAPLGDPERRHVSRIIESATRMNRLIEDLLAFSRASRTELRASPVDLGALVRDVQREVIADCAGRDVDWHIGPLPVVNGDSSLLRLAFQNLLANAVKYTGKRPKACIEVGAGGQTAGEAVVFVRDNGAGFDMTYAHKLFGVFQRLHTAEQFDGTGIGLANVRRIIHRHGGRTWAEGEVDRGASFYVSLPLPLSGEVATP